jgi:hypothetical protein
MGMTLGDAWGNDEMRREEALEVYAEYVEAIRNEFEARREAEVDRVLLERLEKRRSELERLLESRRAA